MTNIEKKIIELLKSKVEVIEKNLKDIDAIVDRDIDTFIGKHVFNKDLDVKSFKKRHEKKLKRKKIESLYAAMDRLKLLQTQINDIDE